MKKIFLSYSRESESKTKTLAADLESLNNSVWFDHELSGGQAWWDQILLQIRESDLFVFVLDNHSLESTACKRELDYASQLSKSILPVLVDDEVPTNLLPAELSQVQYVDLISRDADAVIRLTRAISSLPNSGQLPDTLPVPPDVPISYLGGIAEKIDTEKTLTPEEQKSLLFELRQSVRAPETLDDTLVLIDRFRRRPDLLATIAQELDELCQSSGHRHRASTASEQVGSVNRSGSENVADRAAKKSTSRFSSQPNTVTKRRFPIILLGIVWVVASPFVSYLVFEELNIRWLGLSDDETGISVGIAMSAVGFIYVVLKLRGKASN